MKLLIGHRLKYPAQTLASDCFIWLSIFASVLHQAGQEINDKMLTNKEGLWQ
ncbi:hypothetical protein ACSZNF_01230 [Aeromonas hydrophila]